MRGKPPRRHGRTTNAKVGALPSGFGSDRADQYRLPLRRSRDLMSFTRSRDEMATTPFFVPTVPGSRSISARALICAALARGRSEIVGLADCDDTTAMINVLSGCGVRIAGSGDVTEVWGSPKPAFTSDVMDCF